MSANTTEKVTFELDNLTLEDVQTRHRKEKKELQAKIQALKKNAPKSDKKKRKETMEEIGRLEKELEERQCAELKAVQANEATKNDSTNQLLDESAGECDVSNRTDDDAAADNGEGHLQHEQPQERVTKAQKRRDKKAREAKQREADILAAAEEAENAPKAIEMRTIIAKLKERSLAISEVPSDGDCLYNAIRKQLIQHDLASRSVSELRNQTANFLVANKKKLIFYMTDPTTGDLLNDEQFDEYCTAVRETPAWGGQLELKALSSLLKAPIEVLQASGPPTILGENEFSGPKLVITYHRHMYSLGEHYNSTVPLEDTPNKDGREV